MRQVGIVSALVCFFAVAGLSLLPAQQAAGVADSGRQAWEYRLVSLEELIAGVEDDDAEIKAVENRFNELGREGWELSEYLFRAVVFKRPSRASGRP